MMPTATDQRGGQPGETGDSQDQLQNITNNIAEKYKAPYGGGKSFLLNRARGIGALDRSEQEGYRDGEKENPTPMIKKTHEYTVEEPPSSRKKPVMPAQHREKMELQMEALQGRLHSIRRESIRPMGNGGVGKGTYNIAHGKDVGGSKRMSVMPGHKSVGLDVKSQQQFGGLVAKLESLKREQPGSYKPSSTQEGGSAGFDAHALSKSAEQIFGDEEFVALCEQGLTAQLTRTKDGATHETRMKELADIVKTMRKALKEMQHRAQLFVEQCVKYEKDAASHAEGIKLSAESAAMAASAELANAKRDAATALANHKAALASWQGEVDLHKSEAAGLKRDIERLEQAQEELRNASNKLEAEKTALESELNDIKKTTSTKEKELQAGKNAAAQTVYQVREEYERQKEVLERNLEDAKAKLSAAEDTQEKTKKQLSTVEDERERLTADLNKTVYELEGKKEELIKAQTKLGNLEKEHEALKAQLEKSTTDASAVRNKLSEWQEKASSLLDELTKERETSEKLRKSAENYADSVANKDEWIKKREEEYKNVIEEATRKEKVLLEEKKVLEASLEAATKYQEEAEQTIETLKRDAEAASNDLKATREELSKLKEESENASDLIAKSNEKAEQAEARIAQIENEAAEKVARLTQLEGELEALQECTIGLQGGDQKEMLQRMVSKIASLEAAVVAADAKRREAHNQLVELKGNIRVFCRIRPHPSGVAQCAADGSSIRVYVDSKPYEFNFDKVFKPETSQSAVFDQVSDLVQSALDGYKVCLFSYGQTGAGKTFTMQGGNEPGKEGIIPRSISKILKTVETLQEQGWEYKLEASFVEVYNEQLRDLLVEGREAGRITENNAIQHLPNGGHTIIQGATRLEISSEHEAAEVLRKAASCRAVEATAMNSASSRSHSVFMLYITGCHEATSTMLQGSLNLVDLAGSERLARSQAEGQRAKEACSINKSLSALGDVFAALSAKQTHVPYRNSKLTHLLQPCLGGSGKTLMFVNINAEPNSAQESLCSLRFASKVNSCETAARGGAVRHTSILDRGNTPSSVGAPSRRQSVAPQAPTRRMSMIPTASAGIKRKPMGPLAPAGSSRPKFN